MFFYTFMPKLFNMSLTASVAIVLVVLLRLLLKKAPKVISYALWGVVLFRLLCPVSIGSNFSVYNLFDAPAQESGTITSVIEYVPSNIVHTEYPSVALPVPGISDVINEALPQGQEQLVADPLEAPMSIATYVWMIGVLVMAIYSIVSYIQLRRKLSVVVPLRDNIFIADDIRSPFVVGLFRPKIYLPCNLGDKEQEYIILHEQHHIKRLDHVMKALAFWALAIHWFNPLVWVAFILASKDMEMSCDEAVIRKVDGDVRADYSASLLTLATGRRIIAGTPLAFGEGDTKGRINNLSKWKKPAVWVVIVAVIACIILAVCLLTNPAGYHVDFTGNEIVSASCFDFRSGDDETLSTELNESQIDELMSRLEDVKNTKKSNEYAGFTPGYQISAKLQDESYIRISGYSFDSADMVDIESGEQRYIVTDKDFCQYLSRICAGGDVMVASHSVTKWFDYLVAPDEMSWDGSLEINLPEFPDVTFRWSYGEIVAVKGGEITSLYTGMPIWNTYFCDLTGDGLPELCSTISWGSGMIDNRVIIYDYANGVSYSLEERGVSDYTLRQNESDGQLYVDKTAHVGGGLLSTGRLVFEDDCLQVLWPEKPNDNIREITDPTDDPNFAYDTAVEKIYEDERNEYFISGLYSQHIIVQYTDGTQEDIVTALNAGRATFADLDKFGIRYWAEPKVKIFDTPADKFYLTIGAEGVKSIELSMPNSSGGCENADGSLFKKGERIWLENLDGYNDLRGLTITALGKNGEIIWSASIPNTAENNGFTHLTQDDWVITNIE